jgi:predicted Fe-Mo cluster-binding NifX family protein
MKVCFPVLKAEGMDSEVYGHFGSAPAFMVVETDNNTTTTITNSDQHHAHGACNPLKALDNQRVDAIVVGGIGAGALTKLNQQGIKVFQAQAQTVKENIRMLKEKNLPEFTLQHTCAGHGHAGGCGR